MLGETGTINLNDKFIMGLTYTYFSPLMGWVVALAGIAADAWLRPARTLPPQGRGSERRLDARASLPGGRHRHAFVTMVVVANQDRDFRSWC